MLQKAEGRKAMELQVEITTLYAWSMVSQGSLVLSTRVGSDERNSNLKRACEEW